ncbi:glycosyltransferase [Candidatus Bathyarchaeota archaeon]|nr:glycosyltransferase [Candidatus Bathyarchaeota archaeon]
MRDMQDVGPIALSNPWFGVGGLERVYIAITAVKSNARIITMKNFHDRDTFSYYFGSHRKFPPIFDTGVLGDPASGRIYRQMARAIQLYFNKYPKQHHAHVTNHWGIFHDSIPRADINMMYFQPGVQEMEQVIKDDHQLERYRDALHRFTVVSNSKFMQGMVLENFGHESKVLYPCTDTEYFTAGPKDDGTLTPVQDKNHDLMIFSRLHPGKRFNQAISLFKDISTAIPDSRFLVAGAIRDEDRAFLETLQAIAVKHRVAKKITFFPNPSIEQLRALYDDAKLLVFLPRNEPLGLVAVEAICAGTPVVGFNSGGIVETVAQGITGMKYGNETELVDGIISLLQSPSRIQAMRDKKDQPLSKFSEGAFLESLVELMNL